MNEYLPWRRLGLGPLQMGQADGEVVAWRELVPAFGHLAILALVQTMAVLILHTGLRVFHVFGAHAADALVLALPDVDFAVASRMLACDVLVAVLVGSDDGPRDLDWLLLWHNNCMVHFLTKYL